MSSGGEEYWEAAEEVAEEEEEQDPAEETLEIAVDNYPRRPPPRILADPPVVRVNKLREQLREDGTLDQIAEGLEAVDLRKGGKVKETIRSLKTFYVAEPRKAEDPATVIEQLQREIIERKASNRALREKKAQLEQELFELEDDDKATVPSTSKDDGGTQKGDGGTRKDDRGTHKDDRGTHKDGEGTHKDDGGTHKDDGGTHKDDGGTHKDDDDSPASPCKSRTGQ
ncbi:hypothetical protein BV898_06360 [Hypsibius exemplaris]|uniref:Uncharacterized protein n=1 Tax=Hypsibius exemplaris TaxID=2072580 RepID=A0A1W0WWM4_HYPEX|nr:hypothetical protein BV898_06360 [Hypsibius exemplaris]